MNNASTLLIKALENEGVEVIFGIPGEENLDLLEAIYQSNIKLVLNRHEQAGAFMAATYGRTTGKTGVVLSTLGPGATNFTTAAAYATLGGFPLLMITGQKPIKHSKQGRFQIIDVVSMMKPITKYSTFISDVNMVCSSIRNAFMIAETDKPGAVHIEFAEDVSSEPVTQSTAKVFPISKLYNASTNIQAISKVSELILKAKMPIILLGAATSRDCAKLPLGSDYITKSINTLGIPVFVTQMAKGVIKEDNPNYIGTAALSSGDYIHDLVSKSDLIINIGHDVIEKPPYIIGEKEKEKVLIHIHNIRSLSDNIYNPTLEVIGDIKASLHELASKVGTCKQDFSYAYKVRDFLRNHIVSHVDNNSFPIKPQRLVNDINTVMGEAGTVALDNGMYKIWFARNYVSLRANSLLLDNALATMGAGFPSAMEVARSSTTGEKVLAVVGDGGFMMNSQELETAVRLKLNLVVLIINDNGYGMIKWKQDNMGLSDYGLDFTNPDFVKYAESYGAEGHKVSKTEDLQPLLNKCFNQGGIHLIDLSVDYSENTKALCDDLANREEIS